MYFDWLTWSVWSVGLVLLVYWLIQTTREFKEIIVSQKKQFTNKEKDESEK